MTSSSGSNLNFKRRAKSPGKVREKQTVRNIGNGDISFSFNVKFRLRIWSTPYHTINTALYHTIPGRGHTIRGEQWGNTVHMCLLTARMRNYYCWMRSVANSRVPVCEMAALGYD